jgi:DNA (cytosine-5)-methyltransferase 1
MPSAHGLICLDCGSEPPLFHTPAARDNSGLPPHPAYTSLVTDVYGLAGRELTGIHAPADEPEKEGLWPTVRNAIGAEFGRQYGNAEEQPFLADELDLDGVAHAVVAEVMPLFQTPQARDGKGTPSPGFNEGNLHSQIAELLPTPQAADGNGGKTSQPDVRRAAGHSINLSEVAINTLLPTPGLSDVKTPRRGEELQKCLEGGAKQAGTKIHAINLADAVEDQHGRDSPPSPDKLAWGKYEPAIRRWESLTRPAPAPTEPNKNNNPRLAAAFSEWLMGWPDGWVTDPEIGISRGDQLRIIGNGVCVQQAAAALHYLTGVDEA